MKIIFILFAVIVAVSSCNNDKVLDKDAMTNELCRAFETEKIEGNYEDEISRIFKRHLDPYTGNLSYDSVSRLYSFFNIRLQRDCKVYARITYKSDDTQKGDWMQIEYEPKSHISESDFINFFHEENLRYLEASNDTTKISISDSTWEDHLTDGSFTKLSLRKLPDHKFEITFIESNNPTKKDFSKPGDKYTYKILQKKEGFYDVFVQAKGSELKYIFKIYY